MPLDEPIFLPYSQIPLGYEPIAIFRKHDESIIGVWRDFQVRGVPVVLGEAPNGKRSIWRKSNSLMLQRFTQPT